MKFIFAYTVLLAGLAAGHISLISPCPRYSSIGINCPALPAGQKLDTQMNAPISSVTLNTHVALCKYTVPWPTPAATWKAGESVTIKFNPDAAIHSGGDMEFSISYDGGKTFAVIYQVLRYAFLKGKPASVTNTAEVLQYTFTLPKELPNSDHAVFAWTWVNASGNREFYMNCADVAITGSTSKSYTAKEVTIANYPGYPTIAEFNGNYDTGIQYYTTNYKKITVSPSGTTDSGTGGNPPDSSTTHTPLAPVSKTIHDDTNNRNDSGGGACTAGLMQCSGAGYKVCSNGAWSAVLPCGTGTVCQGTGGNIYCGWPKK
ncbi:hypothetical protein IW140_003803 [Coemansia sp. RSA 1813]|nr:hypothetical protein EV178_004557 [Coemansia sp. RSA 1646]KAJ1769758.1 hypothetical protein LPJ74_003783 [Coemansia sp. RSA 1843]KAJ2090109.1 hypothetical protein IW138_002919 [Coemansia sp. RSA 986]KAJ2214186.1 hypothetical protein EV179_003206 [Coemansia sp. RSA 487]KAJ2568485.1 hypothetical protein IW140_003803 [Coemansia sp. RSA 1813]